MLKNSASKRFASVASLQVGPSRGGRCAIGFELRRTRSTPSTPGTHFSTGAHAALADRHSGAEQCGRACFAPPVSVAVCASVCVNLSCVCVCLNVYSCARGGVEDESPTRTRNQAHFMTASSSLTPSCPSATGFGSCGATRCRVRQIVRCGSVREGGASPTVVSFPLCRARLRYPHVATCSASHVLRR